MSGVLKLCIASRGSVIQHGWLCSCRCLLLPAHQRATRLLRINRLPAPLRRFLADRFVPHGYAGYERFDWLYAVGGDPWAARDSRSAQLRFARLIEMVEARAPDSILDVGSCDRSSVPPVAPVRSEPQETSGRARYDSDRSSAGRSNASSGGMGTRSRTANSVYPRRS